MRRKINTSYTNNSKGYSTYLKAQAEASMSFINNHGAKLHIPMSSLNKKGDVHNTHYSQICSIEQ